MRGSEVQIYADPADIEQLLDSCRGVGELKFTQTLSEVNSRPVQLTDPTKLSAYVRKAPKEWPGMFLVTRASDTITQVNLTMEDGSGTKVSTRQPFNPHAIMIKLGGQIEDDRTLLVTSINTTGETPEAKELFKAFKKIVLRESKYVDGFYVMPRAFAKLESGWRLTPSESNSRSLDLQIPERR